MRSVAEISRLLSRHVAAESAAPAPSSLPCGVFSLEHLGLPGLFGARFSPSLAASERLRSSRQIGFPSRCVACGNPVEEQLPLLRSRLLRPALVLLEKVPYCRRHAAAGPAFWFESTPLGADQLWEIAAPSAPVISEVVARDSAGDRLPPWRVFPSLSPESSGWRQGEGEVWLSVAWQPFWSSLGAEQRGLYLARWPAPTEWDRALFDLPAFAPLTV